MEIRGFHPTVMIYKLISLFIIWTKCYCTVMRIVIYENTNPIFLNIQMHDKSSLFHSTFKRPFLNNLSPFLQSYDSCLWCLWVGVLGFCLLFFIIDPLTVTKLHLDSTDGTVLPSLSPLEFSICDFDGQLRISRPQKAVMS